VPETVKAEEIHFVHGLLRGPAFVGHAIGGDENACAIVAEAAVDKDFFFWMVAKDFEKLRDLLVAGRRPAADGNIDEADAERLGLLAFPRNFARIFAAQVDDGGDAKIF